MWKCDDVFLAAFLISFTLTPLMAIIARKLGALDHPKDRGMHKKSTPLLGGVAMYLGFVMAVLLKLDYSVELKGVLIASTLIFFTGLLDDLFDLRASVKLGVQVLACVILIEYGVVLEVLHYNSLNVLFTIVGVIGITNATNFLDNMDGLAAGLVAISSFIFFCVAAIMGQVWLAYMAAALTACCCGFLPYNFKPARIFMGDCGATFAGFTLASLAVLGEWASNTVTAIAVPLLVLGVFIFDMFMITVLRIKSKKVRNFRQWLEYAGKDHLSHRLHQTGLSERQAVLLVYCCCAVLGAAAYALQRSESIGWSIFGILGYIAFAAASTWILDRMARRSKT